MCGRTSFVIENNKAFYKRYNRDDVFDVTKFKSYNTPPMSDNPIVTGDDVKVMRWGLVPFYEQKKDKPQTLINMRSETAVESGWAHRYIEEGRIIVPVSAYFEWKRIGENEKIPYMFKMKDEEIFSLAGVYGIYQDSITKIEIPTFAILTGVPNSLMEDVHNRMPITLRKDQEEDWLNPDMTEIEHIKAFLKPIDTKYMERFSVSTRVNSPRNDDPGIIKPIDEPELSGVFWNNKK